MKDKIIIILPVKGNSKRVPKKNLRLLNGMPLFAHASCAVIDIEDFIFTTYVSSESEKVKIYCQHYDWFRNNFIFLERPKELSEDPNQIEEVCLYVLNEQVGEYDTLIMVQPSNPFVQTKDIENCYKMFIESNRSTVRSVYKTTKSFFQSFVIYGDKLSSPAFNKMSRVKDCSYPDSYLGNGSLIVIDVQKFKKEKTFLTDCSLGYVMPRERSIDIDEEMDWKIAEMLMKCHI